MTVNIKKIFRNPYASFAEKFKKVYSVEK